MTVASNDNLVLPTVVYIEDDDLCAELVSDGLGERCRILRASDGLAGLELAERILPALVLVDLHLPALTGFEVIERLRANPQTTDIPVLAISARIMAGEEARALALGCRGFVAKPFRLTRLRQEVDAALAPPKK
jgi:CheY-like chemotaxis protein